ncbi:hypothetical protein VTN00DRAFT_9686 [Thermoascus crustaceus]|uniref:uncharacterized protein n=1 Tax=Thermoascus crustaceus TaxID=5088 RepID=UPI003743DA0B
MHPVLPRQSTGQRGFPPPHVTHVTAARRLSLWCLRCAVTLPLVSSPNPSPASAPSRLWQYRAVCCVSHLQRVLDSGIFS